MTTFDELFAEHRLTPEERRALVWHLAAYRARKTVEALLPERSDCVSPGNCAECAHRGAIDQHEEEAA